MQLEKRKKILLVALIAGSVLAISMTFYFYQVFFSPNTMVDRDQPYMLKIPTNSVFKNVVDRLYEDKVINDPLKIICRRIVFVHKLKLQVLAKDG